MIVAKYIQWLVSKDGSVVVPFVQDKEHNKVVDLSSNREYSLSQTDLKTLPELFGVQSKDRFYVASTTDILSKFHILPKSYYDSVTSMSAERFMYGYEVNDIILKKWQKQISKSLKVSFKRNAQKELVF